MVTIWIRAIAAAGLSLLFPGAGHVLLRDWVRALLFAGLFTTAVALLLPVDPLAAAGSIGDVRTILLAEPRTTQFVLGFMLVFAAADAGFRALGFPPGSRSATTDGPACPSCGRELDTDLEFCHWCTTRIEWEEPEPANTD